jgi:hypothetical protein
MSGKNTVDNITVQPITWTAAQKRPFIAATVAALLLIFSLAAGALIHGETGIPLLQLIVFGLLYFVAFVISFLLPMWLVQLVIYSQMWQQGQPYFVNVQSASLLDRKRQCRFILSLRTMTFVLCILYVETRATERYWMKPVWLYLSLCALGLLAFCLLSISIPRMSPLLIISAITFWTSALIFGMGHLVVGD